MIEQVDEWNECLPLHDPSQTIDPNHSVVSTLQTRTKDHVVEAYTGDVMHNIG